MKKIGLIGIVISVFGFLCSTKTRFWKVLFGALFIASVILFSSGTTNYSVLMFGASKNTEKKVRGNEEILNSDPVIETTKEALKEFLNKKPIWLTCPKGGIGQKKFFITKYNIPNDDLVCPNGKILIKYGKGS